MSDPFYQRAFDESPPALINLAWSNSKSKNLEAIKSILTVLEADPTAGVIAGQSVTLTGATGNQEITLAKAFAQALGPMNAEDLHHEVRWTADQRDVFDRFSAVCRDNLAYQANLPIRMDATLLLIHAAVLVVQDPLFFESLDDPYTMLPLGLLSKASGAGNTPALIALMKGATLDTALDYVDSLVPADREITNKSSAAIDALAKLVGPGQARKGGLIDLLDTLDEKIGLTEGKPSTSHIRIDLVRRRLDRLGEALDVEAIAQIAQVMGKDGLDPHVSGLKGEVTRYTEMNRLFGNSEAKPDAKTSTTDDSLMGCLADAAVRRRCLPVIDAILPVIKHKAAGKNNFVALALQHNGPVSMQDLRGTFERLKAHGINLDQVKTDGKVTNTSALAQLASMVTHSGDEQKLAALLDVGIDASPKTLKGIKFADGDAHKNRMLGVIKAHAARRTAHDLLADLDAEPSRSLAP